MIEPPVYGWLNVAAINAYVSGRIYGQDDAGDSPSYPYIVYRVVSASAQNQMTDGPGMDNHRVQIDCYTRDRQEALDLAAEIQTQLDSRGHQLVQIGPSRDFETKSYRVQLDYSFWTNR